MPWSHVIYLSLANSTPTFPPRSNSLWRRHSCLRRALTFLLSVHSNGRWVLRWNPRSPGFAVQVPSYLYNSLWAEIATPPGQPCKNRGPLASDAKPNKGHGSQHLFFRTVTDGSGLLAMPIFLAAELIPPECFLWQLIHQVEREWTRSLKI